MSKVTFIHTVFFWFENPDSESDKIFFKNSLKKFIESSKFIESTFIGTPPNKERSVVDDSFTFSLTVSFTSKENHNSYQIEDVHQKFIEESSYLWSQVKVYDSILN